MHNSTSQYSPSTDDTGRANSMYPYLEDTTSDQPHITSTQCTSEYPPSDQVISPTRAYLVRSLALLASYTLAPLKSRLSRELGTSNTEYGLLISAFSLNGTWTPLVGGMLASKLGTTLASIFATGMVFLGQLLLVFGESLENVRLMTFGLFIYGLGLGPLAVVQESIIVRFFHSHGLGTSMAIGLVAGKFASFLAARASYPLSVAFGRHAPFYVSAALTGFSFIMNIVYMFSSHWLVRGSGVTLEASELRHEARRRAVYSISEAKALEIVAKKRHVSLKEIPLLGDVFWAYIGLNVLCGILWSPFTHLAASLLEQRYNLSEATASVQASYLLAGSIFLYPACGYLVDRIKDPRATTRLFMLSSLLTMFCYAWLALPPQWTRSAIPGVISFSGGFGFSPRKFHTSSRCCADPAVVLLVVIVPNIVPLKYVSTTLGVHKAVSDTMYRTIQMIICPRRQLEHTGSTISQTLAGILLDSEGPGRGSNLPSIQHLLYAFLFFNVLQLVSLKGLSHLDNYRRRRRAQDPSYSDDLLSPSSSASTHDLQESLEAAPIVERAPLLSHHDRASWDPIHHNVFRWSEKRRGLLYAWLSGLLICFAWGLFLGTAWLQLRSAGERGVQEITHAISA
ncbi:major facilitator superfamily domain-containing protein [Boletus reticuloceps]|uniref:Lysosomal dipeptide transporter MFSD1 n=1 Tax=Boletus reticuloceps TaxID=495285 RepID=A0A8I2Z1V6_9AGAM|nr:major facilitator superfamily domain-containing protein [Boletus reticuloceps]